MSDTEFPTSAPAGTAANAQALPILSRIPWEMTGELNVTSNMTPTQMPNATFANNFSKTFEIHQMTVACVALDDEGLPLETQPSQFFLQSLVKLLLVDLLMTQNLTKSATRLSTLTEGDANNAWRWKAPYNLRNQGNIIATLSGVAFPGGETPPFNSIDVTITFKGYLLSQGTGNFTP